MKPLQCCFLYTICMHSTDEDIMAYNVKSVSQIQGDKYCALILVYTIHNVVMNSYNRCIPGNNTSV